MSVQQILYNLATPNTNKMYCPSTKNKALIPLNKGNEQLHCYDLQSKGWSMGISKDINEISKIWDSIAPANNIFLQSDYLKALHAHPATHMGFRYAVLFRDEKPIGIVFLQTYWVRMQDSINKNKTEKPKNFIQRTGVALREWFIRKAVFNVLICGNLLLTGKHGYYIDPTVDEGTAAEIARQAVDLAQRLLEKESGKNIHIQMFKDYPCKDKNSPIDPVLKKASYHSYTIQPAMYMRLPKHWNSFDDYLEEMQSKYRVRARRAAKKGEELNKRELTLEEIEAMNGEIYALYKGIATNVGFNAFTLHPEYFLALKKHLGERFKLVGFFLEGRLVAFCTSIFNGRELEAHFLGVDHEVNREYQVYLNILYSFIDMAIYHKMDSVDFARTALEIKSSVGAVPCDLNIYVRHRNRISSNMIKFIFEYLTPEEEWQPRSPFKDMDVVK